MFKQLAINLPKKKIKLIAKKHLEIRKNFTWLPKNYNETLSELKKHFKLVIVSSGVWPWGNYDFEKIFGFKMKKHFDFIVNSFEYGFLKDSEMLFKIALKKTGLKKKDVAFVGNSYEDDILLAKKFGLKTIFLNKNNKNKKGDLTIISLKELKEKINVIKKL
ncbi:MAG: HAD hydrolase-like protein [Candidatus ainarchaeum sp.]|nr:HAD hydrolase-like protein [Candidatus ainarchaeum sp.]